MNCGSAGHKARVELEDKRLAEVKHSIISELQSRARLSDQAYMPLPQLLQFLAEKYMSEGVDLGPNALLQPASYTGVMALLRYGS